MRPADPFRVLVQFAGCGAPLFAAGCACCGTALAARRGVARVPFAVGCACRETVRMVRRLQRGAVLFATRGELEIMFVVEKPRAVTCCADHGSCKTKDPVPSKNRTFILVKPGCFS